MLKVVALCGSDLERTSSKPTSRCGKSKPFSEPDQARHSKTQCSPRDGQGVAEDLLYSNGLG